MLRIETPEKRRKNSEKCFGKAEKGTMLRFCIHEDKRWTSGILIVREKDTADNTLAGILLSPENISRILNGQSPWRLVIDKYDIEQIISGYDSVPTHVEYPGMLPVHE